MNSNPPLLDYQVNQYTIGGNSILNCSKSQLCVFTIIFCLIVFLEVIGCRRQSVSGHYRKLRISTFERKSPPTDIKLYNISPQPFLILCWTVFGDWEGMGGDNASPASGQYLNVPDMLIESFKEFACFIENVDMNTKKIETVEQKFAATLTKFLAVNYYGIGIPYPIERKDRDEEYEKEYKRKYRKNAKKEAMNLLGEVIASGKEPYCSYSLYFMDVWDRNSTMLIQLADNKQASDFLRFSALCKLLKRSKIRENKQLFQKYSRQIENEFRYMKGWRPEGFFYGIALD